MFYSIGVTDSWKYQATMSDFPWFRMVICKDLSLFYVSLMDKSSFRNPPQDFGKGWHFAPSEQLHLNITICRFTDIKNDLFQPRELTPLTTSIMPEISYTGSFSGKSIWNHRSVVIFLVRNVDYEQPSGLKVVAFQKKATYQASFLQKKTKTKNK